MCGIGLDWCRYPKIRSGGGIVVIVIVVGIIVIIGWVFEDGFPFVSMECFTPDPRTARAVTTLAFVAVARAEASV